VHLIWDYWDQPRSGIADCGGRPHVFRCRFDTEQDDWSHDFDLREIDAALLALASERRAIFRRWAAALKAGRVPNETWDGPHHPALPEDRARLAELRAAIGDPLEFGDDDAALRRRGRFIPKPGAHPASLQDAASWTVEWSTVVAPEEYRR
jgi:hypothetical protein